MSANTVIVDRLWTPPSERSQAALRNGVLVVGFALLTALLAQWEIRLSFTPVPITGQTLGVLLAGGALGWRLGAASIGVYWAFGLIGLPFYAGGDGGWAAGTGATMGYFLGFILAGAAVGYLAERRHDRNLVTSLAAMVLGSVMIYVVGVSWLAFDLRIPLAAGDTNAISLGVTPFLVGDLVKVVLAGALLPAAWAVVDATRRD